MVELIERLLAFFRRRRRTSNLSKEIVITIHGVNPDRNWQERVGRVLAPHFECKTFTYHGYDTILGPVRAVVNVEALLILFSISAFFILLFAINWIVATILLFVAGILSLALSIPAASLMRKHHVNRIKKQINSASAYGRPHIVAHSLGTYLIGNVLAKFHDIHLGNVVLVSSVLPSSYPWAGLLQERPESVLNVRNELGTADRVTKLVAKI